MSALQGYRTQQKSGQPQYQTLQQVGRAGGGSYASDTVQKVLFEVTAVNDAVEAGSTKSIINATAHEALPGDMLRFISTSANPYVEVGVISVAANTITLAGDLPALPIAGDEFKVMRWVTPSADSNGNLVFTPGPLTFDLDGVTTVVSRDTAVPANSVGLPVVNLDAAGNIATPLTDAQLRASPVPVSAATLPLPTGAATEVTLAALEAKVLTDIQLRATPVPVSISSSALPTGAATEAKQDVGNTSLDNIDTKTPALVTGRVPVDGSGVTQPISAASLPLPSGAAEEGTLGGVLTEIQTLNTIPFATETTLAAVSAKLPAALGQTTSAASLSVVVASDQSPIEVIPAAGAAQSDAGTNVNATQGASAATLTAPANTVGFILSVDDTNTDTMYFCIGGTASATNGQQLQPGRDSGFIPCGANVSIFGAASNPRYNMQWLTRS